MCRPDRVSRRGFFKSAGVLAAGGVAMPYLIPASALASAERPGANERIGVGFIGVGRRGEQLTGLPADGQIVAAADVDQKRAEIFANKPGRHGCRAYRTIARCSRAMISTR